VTLAKSWNSKQNPMDYYVSEKLDGVRCLFQHGKLWTRNGNEIYAPEYFLNALPKTICLDGALHAQDVQALMSIVKSNNPHDERWSQVSYQVFDAPLVTGPFSVRLEALRQALASVPPNIAKALEQSLCLGRDHVMEQLNGITSMGGEGVMLKKEKPEYTPGRSNNLLKVKKSHDAEAMVVGYEPGKGKHEGRMGALKCKMIDSDGGDGEGQAFKLGTGFTDAERETPPAIGSTVTYKYQELNDKGIPRFPTYLRQRLGE
jgi:DNA ligase 1